MRLVLPLLALLAGCQAPSQPIEKSFAERLADEENRLARNEQAKYGHFVLAGYHDSGLTEVFVLDSATGQVCRAVFTYDPKKPNFSECVDR